MSGGGPRPAFNRSTTGFASTTGSDVFLVFSAIEHKMARRCCGPSTRHGYRHFTTIVANRDGGSENQTPVGRRSNSSRTQGNMQWRRRDYRGRVRHSWIWNQYIPSQKKAHRGGIFMKRFSQKRLFINMTLYCNETICFSDTKSNTINITREIFTFYSKISTRDLVKCMQQKSIHKKSAISANLIYIQTRLGRIKHRITKCVWHFNEQKRLDFTDFRRDTLLTDDD